METFWKFETQSHNPVAGILLRNDTHVANIQHWECGETDSEKTTKYGKEIERKLNSHAALLAACKSMVRTLDSGTFGYGMTISLEHQIKKMKSAIEQAEESE